MNIDGQDYGADYENSLGGSAARAARSSNPLQQLFAQAMSIAATQNPGTLNLMSLPTLNGINKNDTSDMQSMQPNIDKAKVKADPSKSVMDHINDVGDKFKKVGDNLEAIPVKIENLAHPLLAAIQSGYDYISGTDSLSRDNAQKLGDAPEPLNSQGDVESSDKPAASLSNSGEDNPGQTDSGGGFLDKLFGSTGGSTGGGGSEDSGGGGLLKKVLGLLGV